MPQILCFTFVSLGTDRRKRRKEHEGWAWEARGGGGGCLVVMPDGRRFFCRSLFFGLPIFIFFICFVLSVFVLILCILDIMCLSPSYFPV